MSDSENESEKEPKLVVDTDWKEQVAREKEMASQKKGSEDPATESTPDDSGPKTRADVSTADVKNTDGSKSSNAASSYPPAPPASFEILVSMMFTQAMAMLGLMPDPAGGETTVNKPYAKHYIDTLDMLGEKTKGNLSDEESKILSEALHALRMAYVNAKG